MHRFANDRKSSSRSFESPLLTRLLPTRKRALAVAAAAAAAIAAICCRRFFPKSCERCRLVLSPLIQHALASTMSLECRRSHAAARCQKRPLASRQTAHKKANDAKLRRSRENRRFGLCLWFAVCRCGRLLSGFRFAATCHRGRRCPASERRDCGRQKKKRRARAAGGFQPAARKLVATFSPFGLVCMRARARMQNVRPLLALYERHFLASTSNTFSTRTRDKKLPMRFVLQL